MDMHALEVLMYHVVAGNVYGALPHTWGMNISIFLMIIHQICAFIYFNAPLFYLWEKLWGIHEKPLWVCIPSRLPISKLLTLLLYPALVVLVLDPPLCWEVQQVMTKHVSTSHLMLSCKYTHTYNHNCCHMLTSPYIAANVGTLGPAEPQMSFVIGITHTSSLNPKHRF